MRMGVRLALVAVAAAAAVTMTGVTVFASAVDSSDQRGMVVPAPGAANGHAGGVVWSPASCAERDAAGSAQRGWMRSAHRMSATLRMDSFYLDKVAHIPGGVDLAKIRELALTCREGRLILDGTVAGVVTYSDSSISSMPGAQDLSMRVEVSFPATEDATAQAVMAKYGYGGDGEAYSTMHVIHAVVIDNIMFSVLGPDGGGFVPPVPHA